MSFAKWKRRTKLIFDNMWPEDVSTACKASYKAGLREGRKDTEKMAKRAIELRALLDSKQK